MALLGCFSHENKKEEEKVMKIVKIIVCVILFTVFIAGNSFAVDLAAATIEKVGVDAAVETATTSANIIHVTDSSFEGTLMVVMSSDLGDAGLATALTAFSLGKTVFLRVGSTTDAITTATVIYINN